MIRVLITEDSPTVALLLNKVLLGEPDMEIVGHARNGHDAIAMNRKLNPDLITMDIVMPGLDGVAATREIMSSDPVPIVVVSSHADDDETKYAFQAMEEGAVAVMPSPGAYGEPDFEAMGQELVRTIRAMAEVKLVTRRRPRVRSAPAPASEPAAVPAGDFRIVAIGCSTGGPMAMKKVLSDLSPGFPVPMVVTQHISDGFIGGLVEWLAGSTPLEVGIAAHRETLRPGVVYFAPDGRHLRVSANDAGLYAMLDGGAPINGFCPSIDILFDSIAGSCGQKAVGALLTGMGSDGAAGLLQLRQAGGITFVQDEHSAVIYGMPGEAMALGAAEQAVPLDAIGAYLMQLTADRPRDS